MRNPGSLLRNDGLRIARDSADIECTGYSSLPSSRTM